MNTDLAKWVAREWLWFTSCLVGVLVVYLVLSVADQNVPQERDVQAIARVFAGVWLATATVRLTLWALRTARADRKPAGTKTAGTV